MKEKIDGLVKQVLQAYAHHTKSRVFTVAISGIDASGKGYITRMLQEELEGMDYKVANINVDPWQNPIPVRLQKENAAENFYNTVFRWQDFFDQLVQPLQAHKSIRLKTMLIRTDADAYYPFTYQYDNTDILLIEGIFLFQERFLSYYDQRVWVDCSFETGMKRAIERNIEKLDFEELLHDYKTYYYPAQRFHFAKDHPREKADVIFNNDDQQSIA